jgi:uncharacterized membrane protein
MQPKNNLISINLYAIKVILEISRQLIGAGIGVILVRRTKKGYLYLAILFWLYVIILQRFFLALRRSDQGSYR